MSEIIENFKDISKIPHCSFDTKKLADFLSTFAKKNGAKVKIDEAFNIHCIKGNPKICLQSHYDMVCMGEAPNIKLKEEKGNLKAINSSLGADNGMGVAMMMQVLKDFDDAECLFTNDEEVGLLGAKNLKHKIQSKFLLNLDHEVDNEVVISCAGGIDIKASMKLSFKEEELEIYELSTENFKGGHSGIDIINNVKNAIKELAYFILENKGILLDFQGGERINSIAKHAKALVAFKKKPKENELIKCKYLGFKRVKSIKQSSKILRSLVSFAQGVRAYDKELQIVRTSINLSLLKIQDDRLDIELFARSNILEDLLRIKEESKIFFKSFGFKVAFSNFYEPWQTQKSDFASTVLTCLSKHIKDCKILAVHAGLECGIIEKKQSLLCACIGPNIHNPHSVDERCEIASVNKIYAALKDILKLYQSS